MTEERIVQFGTSRFLQAHVDLLAQEAAEAGQAVPPIVIVQVTDDMSRSSRLVGFNGRDGFPVRVRGRGPEGVVDRTAIVRSVTRGLVARRDWQELRRTFVESARCVVSNSGDTGYLVAPEDVSGPMAGIERVPRSFPAILLQLLYLRWRAGCAGVSVLPCELVRRNGDTLRGIVCGLASQKTAPDAFVAWLESECQWANTLVDRIVSEAIEPAGAVAEPYVLWAVERQPRLAMPFVHPALVLTDDLARYERLKLHILNLGHTWLAEEWLRAGSNPRVTVLQMVSDERVQTRLRHVFEGEVVPGFGAHGLDAEARTYVERTLERFDNPFLAHKLADIFSSHPLKVEKRIAAFIEWVEAAGGDVELRELRTLAARYARGGSRAAPRGLGP